MTIAHIPADLRRNWLLLGFRLGQLTDIFRPHQRDDDDLPLVGQLLMKLRFTVGPCITDIETKTELLQTISDMKAIWRQGADLDAEYYEDKKFELIYSQLLQIAPSFQVFAIEAQGMDWFDVGRLLGQSSGCCIYYFEGVAKAETCWDYRDLAGLTAQLCRLGTNLEEVSGLPETDKAKVLNSFLDRLPVDAPIMKRYPYLRWGWAFIEERFQLKSPPGPDSEMHSEEHTNERSERTPEPPVPVMKGGLRTKPPTGYLDLIVDLTNKKVPIERLNYEKTVEVTADRLWNLFCEYFNSGEIYLTKKYLKEKWKEIGREPNPQPNFVNTANSELRNKLAVLGIDVVANRNEAGDKLSEWRLDDINPANEDD